MTSEEYLFQEIVKEKYLFSWNEIPGKDEIRLKEFLKKYLYMFNWDKISGDDKEGQRLKNFLNLKLSIKWVKTAQIEKIDGDKIIISNKKKSLSIILNKEKTKANIEIDNNRNNEFIVKLENGKLSICEKNEWISAGLFRKINDKTIKIDTNKDFSLELMKENKVKLKIDNDRTDEFKAWRENGKLNIYRRKQLNTENYEDSKHLINYEQNFSKINILLNLTGKIIENQICPDIEKTKEILLEQTIIAAVSCWESYFSDVYEQILNDNVFINNILENKNIFKKFLYKFNLVQSFREELFFNGNKINDNLRFGTFIIEKTKINFQELDNSKKLLNILFDIDIVKIDETHWTNLTKLFNCRYEIIHKPNKLIISQIFSREEIENIIKSMTIIIETVDKKLFTKAYTKMSPIENVTEI